MQRAILHADLDAFYASVEQLDNPELRGKPVVVGGPQVERGVVAAASYEARRFGVRSAMPMSTALRRCPQAVRVPPRFDRYGDISRRVMAIFRSFTPLVEPMSLDEAFLDVSEQVDGYDGLEALARQLKKRVKQVTHLTVSIGGGTNKTVAKIASDMGKPDGLVLVPAGTEAAFLAPLSVRALWGVGPKAEAVLNAAGFKTVGDIAQAAPEQLGSLLGSRGEMLQQMARGIDERGIELEQERKSVGAETTFARDLPDGAELRAELKRVVQEVARRLTGGGFKARTVVLKLRYANFRTITRQTSRSDATDDVLEIEAAASALLDVVAQNEDRFRLLGIHCTKLTEREGNQLGLWRGRPGEKEDA